MYVRRPIKGLRLSPVRKRSITMAGRKTSVTLEDAFWTELRRMAHARCIPLGFLAHIINVSRSPDVPLSSALRTAAMGNLQSQIKEQAA
jgi:predicted DNA-binding ribbon-helix-helix protein